MELSAIMLTLGALFLAGLAADVAGRRTRLPRVTLLLICGLVVGEAGFGLLPAEAAEWYDFLAIVALTMVAFLLGGAFDGAALRARGAAILSISLGIVVATLAVVGIGLWLAGLPPALALLLGAIATATDPAATQDAIRQSGHTGAFGETLRGIVAIDDAWGVLVFSLAIVAADMIAGSAQASGPGATLLLALWEVGGAVLLGLVIGFPAAILTGRLSPGEPLRTEALGLVFLTAGAALWLEVSYLIAGMTVGAVIVNRARHHDFAFHEIEALQWPFMLLFFLLAGATLDPSHVWALGLVGLVYCVLRIVARQIGGWAGAALAAAPPGHRLLYGLALLPQAGVAVGMALVVADQFPQWRAQVMTLTIGTTVAFELLAPFLTIWAVRRADPPDACTAPTE